MKQKRRDDSQLLSAEGKKLLFLAAIAALFAIFARRYFFISLFIVLNYLVLWMKLGLGVDSPIEVISFGTFMSGYVYGPAEGMIVALSSVPALALTGRISFSKLYNNLLLLAIGLSAQFSRALPIYFAGIMFLALRYVIEISSHLAFSNSPEILRKIPDKAVNFIFHIFIYMSFSESISGIMV